MRIQIREDSFSGDRPPCPHGCSICRLHRHGHYTRSKIGDRTSRQRVQLYHCDPCKLTVSIVPADLPPYRPISLSRLESFLDEKAGIRSGPDPPPAIIEEGCLQRAFKRLESRVSCLKNTLGQIVSVTVDSAAALWRQIRPVLGSLSSILNRLNQIGRTSLLGEYKCLQLPPQA